MPVEVDAGPRRFDADVFAARLASEGIDARVVGDAAGGVEPSLGFSGGFRLVVPSEAADRVREIERELQDDLGSTTVRRSAGVRGLAWSIGVFMVVCLFAGVAAGILGIGRGAGGPTAGLCPDRPTGPIQLSCPR